MPAASALAGSILALALTAQSASAAPPEDGPVATAPTVSAAEALPGLDEAPVEIPPGATPATAETSDPAAVAAAKSLTVEPKTMVQGRTLQVVLGQRALFMLDDMGWPVLLKVEEGQLAAAHAKGEVDEHFGPPPAGQIAAALDGSAEIRATVLKVWNETDQAVDYDAIALVLTGDKVTPAPAPVCGVAPGGIRTQTWRRPVVAVGLGRFKQTDTIKACE